MSTIFASAAFRIYVLLQRIVMTTKIMIHEDLFWAQVRKKVLHVANFGQHIW